MPKRKTKNLETIDELIEDIQEAEHVVKEEVIDEPQIEVDDTPQTDVDKKRNELKRLSEDGEIDQSVAYLKKASAKVINKIYEEWEVRRMEKANVFLCDLLISKFAHALGGFNAIEPREKLENELITDQLLKRDVEKFISYVSPYLPFWGLLSGGLTTSKHVFSHMARGEIPKGEPPNEEN